MVGDFFLSLYGERVFFLILNGSIFWKKNGWGFFLYPYMCGGISLFTKFFISLYVWGAFFLILNGSIFWKKIGGKIYAQACSPPKRAFIRCEKLHTGVLIRALFIHIASLLYILRTLYKGLNKGLILLSPLYTY